MNNLFTLIGSIVLKDEATEKLSKMEQQVKSAGDKMESIGNGVEKAGNNIAGFGAKVTAGVTAPILGAGAASSKIGINFEASMSQLQAISGATGKDLGKLEGKAKELGRSTKYSASEASNAMTNLAQMGWTTEEIMLGVEDTLMLAAAGGIEMADSAMIMANTMNQYNLEASESQRVSDIFAFTAANAGTDVYEMSEALKYAGANASSMGVSLEDTAAMIGVLGDAGVTGSTAGTSLNAMLRDLKKNAEDGKIAVGDQTVALYNSKGEMRNIIDVIEDVMTATEGMTEEQKNNAISSFLGEEALRGYNSIALQGKDAVRNLSNEIKEGNGSAKKMADIMGDNLAGKIDTMKSSLEDTAITIFESLKPTIEKVVETITKLSQAFGALPGPMQATIVKALAIAAAVGPVILIGGKIVATIGKIITIASKFTKVIRLVSAGFKAARVAMIAVTGPVGLIVAGIAAVIAIIVLLWKNWDTVSKLISKSWEWLKEKLAEGWEAIKEVFKMGWDKIKEMFTEGWDNLKEIVSGGWDLLKEMFSMGWDKIKESVSEGWQAVKDGFSEGWENLKEIFTKIKDFFVEYHMNALNTVIDFVTDIWDTVKEKFSEGVESVKEIFTDIKESFNEGIEGIKEGFSNFGEWINEKVSGGLDFLVDLIPDKFSSIKQSVSDIVEEIKGAIIDKFEFIKTTLSNILSFIVALFTLDFGKMKEIASKQMEATKEFISKTWDRIKSIFSTVINSVKEIASKGFEKIKELISKPINAAKDKIGEILDKIKGFFSKKPSEMAKIAGDKFKKIKDKLWKPVEEAKEKIGKAIDKIKGFFSNLKLEIPPIKLPKLPSPKISGKFSMDPPSVPKISWNAKGGIFDEPTIFNTHKGYQGVGEAGPEAIMPLDKLKGWIGDWMNVKDSRLEYISSKGLSSLAEKLDKNQADLSVKEENYNININFNGDMTIDNEEREESISDKLKEELDSYFRSRGERR